MCVLIYTIPIIVSFIIYLILFFTQKHELDLVKSPVIAPPTNRWAILTFKNKSILYEDGEKNYRAAEIYLKIAPDENN